MLPEGIRNNNPGNIEYFSPGIPYEGLADCVFDGKMYVFKEAVYGLRALMEGLHAARFKHQRMTVKQIMMPYAPPEENDTAAYIQQVCEQNGWSPNQSPDFTKQVTYIGFAKSIVVHENGWCHQPGQPPYWYPDSLYQKALDLTGFFSASA